MGDNKRKGGLGRGLSTVFGQNNIDEAQHEEELRGSSSLEEIALDQIEANPDQPRREFDSAKMQELADSIRQLGVVTAITVRKSGEGKYQIISGERRYRASVLAGKKTIPAYIKDITDNEVREMALVENIQREDLNAIEIALAFKNLMECCNYTHEQVSERVGKNRSTVTNYLRILNLPSKVQIALKDHTIELGHAKALLSLDGEEAQTRAFEDVVEKHLSVRKTEEMVREMKEAMEVETGGEEIVEAKPKKGKAQLGEAYVVLQSKLQNVFTPKAKLTRNEKGVGKIEIPFASDDELERLFEILDTIRQGEGE